MSGRPYPIRSLIVQHANALGSYSNLNLVQEALRSENLDLLVVQDLFATPTSAYADFVIPAASWMEKPWMYVAGENKQVMATRRVVNPEYDRISDYEFFSRLGHATGQGEAWPATLEDMFDSMLAPAGLSFEELSGKQKNWIDDGSPSGDSNPADVSFGTMSKRVELSSNVLERCGYDPVPDFIVAEDDEPGLDLTLLSGATDICLTHTDHRQIASLRKRRPHPTVRLNSSTALRLGISEGDWVELSSPRGAIRQKVNVHESVQDGAVDSERWWFPEREAAEPTLYDALSCNVNVLTRDDPALCDPVFGTWPFRVGRASMRKLNEQ